MVKDMCRHCRYKRFTCPWFRCDPYKEAQRKHSERWFHQKFPIEDFNGEDRYVTGLFLKGILILLLILFGIYSSIKIIGEWIW